METDRILARLAACATDPLGYARAWKEAKNRPVIGSFPMNFPGELAHAAGALPLILQNPATLSLMATACCFRSTAATREAWWIRRPRAI